MLPLKIDLLRLIDIRGAPYSDIDARARTCICACARPPPCVHMRLRRQGWGVFARRCMPVCDGVMGLAVWQCWLWCAGIAGGHLDLDLAGSALTSGCSWAAEC